MASIYGITQADLETRIDLLRLIELTDDESSPTGAVGAAVLDIAIGRAELEFEGSAARLYALPVAPMPAHAREKLIDLAAYYVMARKPEQLSPEGNQGNYWTRLRKELLTWLEDVGTNPAALAGVALISTSSTGRGAERVAGSEGQFNRTVMGNF